MNPIPTIVICGRPNVGKSTLFNALAKKRIAIVDPTPGVTRDRIVTTITVGEKHCRLVDTGGIGLEREELGEQITLQARKAIEEATLVLLLVDIQTGITPLDTEVASLLKKHYSHKCIWLVANKADYPRLNMEKDQFRQLGFGEPFCISVTHSQNIGELKELLEKHLSDTSYEMPTEMPLKIAVVGKTNTGKSTFINALAEEERVIVSELPGTTRDSIDVYFEKDGKTIVAIDTAGLKKGRNVRGNVDFYSQARAQKAIRRADVVIFMFDASMEISKADKQIACYIRDEYKPAIIAVNKWDLAKNVATPAQYEDYLTKSMPGIEYAPMIFTTAKTSKKVAAAVDLARNLFKQASQRITTGELNRVLRDKIVAKRSPPVVHGRSGKIYYATQVAVHPPVFVFFVNEPRLFNKKYRRYLFNQFQLEFGFPEIPVKFDFQEHESGARPPR